MRSLLAAFLLLTLALPAQAQTPALFQTARLAYADGDYDGVIAQLAAADSLHAAGAHLLGKTYQMLDRHEEAVAAFQRADTTDWRVAYAIGRSYDRMGEWDASIPYYEAAYQQDSTRHRVATALAGQYRERRMYDRVVAIYERLLEADDQNSDYYLQLGQAFRQQKLFEEAIPYLERAHRLDLRSESAALAVSNVYYQMEQLISARRALDRSLEARPNSPLLWARRGDVTLAEERFDDAILSYRNTITHGDSSALAFRNLGVSLYLGGAFDAAHDTLGIAYQADSTDAMSTFYYGMTHLGNAEYDAALYYFDRATELLGQDMISEVHQQIAATYDRMERDGDAIRSYRLALTLAPAKREILFHLAALYDTFYADKNVALQEYERFLSRVGPGELEQQQNYATHRTRELRERLFFEGQLEEETGTDADTSQAGQ